MALVGDASGSGLVAESLAHPGGNVTGLSAMAPEFSVKRLQLLLETVPRLTRVAVLWDPGTPWHTKAVEDLKAAAHSLSIEVEFVGVRIPEEFGPAFSAVTEHMSRRWKCLTSALSYSHRATILELASKARLPTIYSARQYVDEGGLMSYGTNYGDLMRRSAGYVDKILKGAKPGDLPIEQPTRFELVVNLKTAKGARHHHPRVASAARRRGDPVTRRAFAFALIALAVSLGLFGLSSTADAQQPAPARRIGVVLVARSPDDKEWQAFRQGLLELGYAEGRNLVIEWRFSSGDYARVPELVADLVQRRVEVIVVDTTVATQTAKRATSTIPIVMTSIADPVGSGLVASLARPGGNITGLSIMATDLGGKRLQLLGIDPRLARVAVLAESGLAIHTEGERGA